MSPKKIIFIYGNCLVKILKEYLNMFLYDNYEIYTFYILDNINTFDKDIFLKTDIFIYQNVSELAFKNDDGKNFTSDKLLALLSTTCLTISFPSVYFSAYFPYNVSPTDVSLLPENIKQYIPNYCFDKTLFNMLIEHPCKSVDEIVTKLNEPDLYTDDFILQNLNITYNNLKTREKKNNIDVKLSDYLLDNCYNTRLCMTTNHPSKEVYSMIINQILKKLNETFGEKIDTVINSINDKMEKVSKPPILKCVSKYFNIIDNPPYYSLNIRFNNLKEYVTFYHKLMSGH